MRALVASFLLWGCSLPTGGEPIDGTTSTGDEPTDRPPVVPERIPEDLPASTCEPAPSQTCSDVSAPELDPLEPAERLGIATRSGIAGLFFGDTTLRRVAPLRLHPAYLFLIGVPTPEISASLAPQTSDRLSELLANAPEDPGPYTDYAEATIRLADQQMCFAHGCGPLDALLEFAAEVDAQLLDAFAEQESGVLYAFEEIAIVPWPLAWDWDEGGHVDVDKEVWDSVERGWYADEQGHAAYVARFCTGTTAGCTAWTLDINPATVVDSPLTETDHRQILETAQAWSLHAVAVEGEAFIAVRNADAIAFPDPDDPKTSRWVSVLATANPVLDRAF